MCQANSRVPITCAQGYITRNAKAIKLQNLQLPAMAVSAIHQRTNLLLIRQYTVAVTQAHFAMDKPSTTYHSVALSSTCLVCATNMAVCQASPQGHVFFPLVLLAVQEIGRDLPR
jgi:hypothetical protein